MPTVAPGPVTQLRPRLRPATPVDPVPPVPDAPDTPPAYAPGARPDVLPDAPGYSIFAVASALRPAERPRTVSVRAEQQQAERARGAICGSPDIQGDVVAPVTGSGGCGIAEPVRVRSVSGVQLSTPALMDCPTAQALNTWVAQGAVPAIGSHGGGLRTLQVMGHYTCRPMNNQAGQRLSEHGRGRAIDIGGFGLRNGTQISVLRGWNREGDGRILRQMHRAACGTFGTVLGPDSNRFHSDHFHFDTARHRNGSFCR
ncbi:MAG: extensin family protein [Rubellimicrobium sp.]|nr:extensin family protein [Rubellimicrobium sp.]